MDQGKSGYTDSNQRAITSFGREWRVDQGSELVAATIRMDQFEGPEHSHPEAQVAMLLSGSSATFSRRGVFGFISSPVSPGSFVYIPSGELHRTHWHRMTELTESLLDGRFLAGAG